MFYLVCFTSLLSRRTLWTLVGGKCVVVWMRRDVWFIGKNQNKLLHIVRITLKPSRLQGFASYHKLQCSLCNLRLKRPLSLEFLKVLGSEPKLSLYFANAQPGVNSHCLQTNSPIFYIFPEWRHLSSVEKMVPAPIQFLYLYFIHYILPQRRQWLVENTWLA